MRQELLQASGLTRRFGRRVAVAGVDLALSRGEVVGLLGLNGAVQTTTLGMLCGVLAPTAGSVVIAGHDLLDEPRAAKRSLGYLPEAPPLQPDARVRDYLRWAARLRRVPRPERDDAVARALARCDLEAVATRVIRNLSQGYQQRVGIAQAIVHDPAVIVLDEPSVGLDPRQVHGIRALVQDLRRDHGVLFSSHLLGEVQAVCDRVLILHHGAVVHAGRVADPEASGHRYHARFDAPPELSVLGAVPGVRAATRAADGGIELALATDDALDALVREAATGGWRLRELRPARPGLEQIFLECTDPGTGAAA